MHTASLGGLHCQSEGASWKASFKRATSAPYKSSVTLKVTFQYFIIWKIIIPSYASYSDKWEISHQELFYLIITFPIKSTSLLLSQNKDIPNFKNLRKQSVLPMLAVIRPPDAKSSASLVWSYFAVLRAQAAWKDSSFLMKYKASNNLSLTKVLVLDRLNHTLLKASFEITDTVTLFLDGLPVGY